MSKSDQEYMEEGRNRRRKRQVLLWWGKLVNIMDLKRLWCLWGLLHRSFSYLFWCLNLGEKFKETSSIILNPILDCMGFYPGGFTPMVALQIGDHILEHASFWFHNLQLLLSGYSSTLENPLTDSMLFIAHCNSGHCLKSDAKETFGFIATSIPLKICNWLLVWSCMTANWAETG